MSCLNLSSEMEIFSLEDQRREPFAFGVQNKFMQLESHGFNDEHIFFYTLFQPAGKNRSRQPYPYNRGFDWSAPERKGELG